MAIDNVRKLDRKNDRENGVLRSSFAVGREIMHNSIVLSWSWDNRTLSCLRALNLPISLEMLRI